MNVLVTGASGFIGRSLVHRLLARGHRVRALLRRIEEPATQAGSEVTVGDVRDAAAVERATRGMDGVVHLACATGVARAGVVTAVNVEGTRHVLDSARANGARRVVFVSSISATRERMGPYGRTKREGEALVATSGLEWAILRPSLVFGAGSAGLFARLARSLRSPVVPVIGDGSIELDPVYVDDVCEVIEQCLTRPDVVRRTYDLLGPERLTFEALLRRLATAIGARPRFVHLPGPLALALARALGWVLERPPLSEDNVLGMISPARVDGSAARRDFPISWTPLEKGLEALGRAA
jgi:NADH dehydrogenase